MYKSNVAAFELSKLVKWLQVVIVSNENEKREFIREIGEEVLPEEYGGRAKLVAIQDVELTPVEDWFYKSIWV